MNFTLKITISKYSGANDPDPIDDECIFQDQNNLTTYQKDT